MVSHGETEVDSDSGSLQAKRAGVNADVPSHRFGRFSNRTFWGTIKTVRVIAARTATRCVPAKPENQNKKSSQSSSKKPQPTAMKRVNRIFVLSALTALNIGLVVPS